MKIVYAAEHPFVPAGHENPRSPGVWKRVLLVREDFQPGNVQMINWAKLPPGRTFAGHYHEDMQEVFVILQGVAQITVAGKTIELCRGDAVRIDPREVHRMHNPGSEDVEYLAIGITAGTSGRTVVVEPTAAEGGPATPPTAAAGQE